MGKAIKYIFLLGCFTISFGIIPYALFQGLYSVLEAVFMVFLSVFLWVYILISLAKKRKFNSVEIYIGLLVLVPIYTGLAALREFGQPLLYGILSQRHFLLSVTGVLILLLLKKRIITLDHVEKSFLILSWSSLVIFTILWFVLDPANCTDNLDLVAMENSVKGGYIFTFKASFIVFGAIYYMIMNAKKRSAKTLIFAFLFASYLVLLHRGRIAITALLFTLAVFYLRDLSMSKKIVFFVRVFISLTLIVGIAYVAAPDLTEFYFNRYIAMFESVFMVLSGAHSGDPSADARINTIIKAAPYIRDNFWLGSGNISQQWRGGFKSLLGYFYPSDIGIVGALFCYGFLGTVLIYMQYLLAYLYIFRIKKFNTDQFFLSCRYFLLYFFISSFVTGQAYSAIGVGVSMLAIIYYYRYSELTHNYT